MSNNDLEWFSLKKAADQLGVHPTTLRRWADDGQIAYVVTAGGHRRFAAKTLNAFMQHRAGTRPVDAAWADRALTHARDQVAQNTAGQWMQSMDESVRTRHRTVGRKLMGLTLQFVASETDPAQLLQDARLVGVEYGELSKSTGVPLHDALEAALFFRDRLLEATWELPASTRGKPSNDHKIERRINALLNVVQLAIADVYETR